MVAASSSTVLACSVAPCARDWAATEIRGAYDYGLIDEPLNSDMRTPINRAQFCSLVRAVIEQAKGKKIDKLIGELGKSGVSVSFKDTSNKDVAALCRLGIINGTSNTTFAPKDKLTREQAAKIMRGLAEKNIGFHKRIEITSKRTTREKLLTYLAITAKREGKAHFEIPFDRQELADYLEVDRSGLSAEISKMRREGILDSKKNSFTLY